MRLNLGCGGCVPDGWINVDFSFGAKLFKIPVFKYINKKLGFFNLDWDESIKIHDLTKKFPWEDNSIKVIYSSHTLEHLSKEEGRFFLKECYRVLDDNGIIRIVVPDLEVIVKSYSNGTVSADDFLDKLGVLYRKREGYLKNMFSPFVQFPHKCMYDHKTL
ncbi:MAG TPA: methyltransferase domain-containing protein, partial [Gammaproteobacteria bacterium]|nr:methyltransferase domain-containing protein [Gammaproteobacteria bacterium]